MGARDGGKLGIEHAGEGEQAGPNELASQYA